MVGNQRTCTLYTGHEADGERSTRAMAHHATVIMRRAAPWAGTVIIDLDACPPITRCCCENPPIAMPIERLDDFSRLSRLVVRVLGLNPGPFSLQGTNTYLVGGGRSRLLIDAGEGMSGYVPMLLKTMKQEGAETISDVLMTHYHCDHTEGLKDLRAHFGDELRAWKLQPSHKGEHGPSFDLIAAGVRELSDGQELSTEDGDATVKVLATPGHTPDHACLLLREEGSVFSGDCVLGGSSAVFENLRDYMRSLHTLLGILPPAAEGDGGAPSCADGSAAARIYPGHGPVIADGRKAVEDYIEHRNARERQVVTTLEQVSQAPLRSLAGLSSFGIVRAIYPQLGWKLRCARRRARAAHPDVPLRR